MDMGVVGIGVFVNDIGLVAISHLLHVPLCQLRQLPVRKDILRCRRERDVQDGLFRIPVRQQVVLE